MALVAAVAMMAAMAPPEWQPDVSVGEWITARLSRLDGSVGMTVPAVFDAYARVLHPPHTAAGRPSTWAAVCAHAGATPHALMQWRTISRTHDVAREDGAVVERSAWPGSPPDIGSLPPATLRTLLDVLATSTGDQRCLFALWAGWGWCDTRITAWTTSDDGVRVAEDRPPGFPSRILDGPRLHVPGRSYLLFTGLLSDAVDVGEPHRSWPQSPNLFWPGDRSWCAATEIDFDSTVVGGSPELVASVLGAPGLEAWPVAAGDALTWDADVVNA